VIYLFTTSNKPGARLIRWGLETDVSHMAVLNGTFPLPVSVVLEARLSDGVDITWLKTFKKNNTVITALKPKDLGHEEAKKLFDKMAQKIGGKSYDWKGVGYLALAAVYFVKIMKGKLKGSNHWAERNKDYCSEALLANVSYLKEIGVDLKKYPIQMLTPSRAREILLESGAFEDVTDYFKA